MNTNSEYVRLAALALVPTLAACGGASGGLNGGNGLPYADGTQNGGVIALQEGDTVTTQVSGVRIALEDQLVRAPISIERVDAAHIRVNFNGEERLLEQVGGPASTVFHDAVMSIDFGNVAPNALSLGSMTYLGDGGISAGLVTGYATDPANLPTSGTAFYDGQAYVERIGGMGVHMQETWDLAIEADFDNSEVSALIATPHGFAAMDDTPFGANGFRGDLIGPVGLTGEMDGQFYDQNGKYIAGTLYLADETTFSGVYQARSD